MKTDFKSWYVIYDPQGNPILRTLDFIRRDCINEFLKPFPSDTTWEYARKQGWRCVKINFTITPSV